MKRSSESTQLVWTWCMYYHIWSVRRLHWYCIIMHVCISLETSSRLVAVADSKDEKGLPVAVLCVLTDLFTPTESLSARVVWRMSTRATALRMRLSTSETIILPISFKMALHVHRNFEAQKILCDFLYSPVVSRVFFLLSAGGWKWMTLDMIKLDPIWNN